MYIQVCFKVQLKNNLFTFPLLFNALSWTARPHTDNACCPISMMPCAKYNTFELFVSFILMLGVDVN